MKLAGSLTGFSYISRTVTAAVGGVACSGASVTVPAFTYVFSGLSLAATCGTAGQAVTLFVNGQPAGLRTSTGATCLAFAPGTSLGGLTVTAGGTPDTSCAGGAGASGSSSALVAGLEVALLAP